MRGKLSNTWGWSIVLGIDLYLVMICYAICRHRSDQVGIGDGDGQCKFDGEFFLRTLLFLFRLVGIVDLNGILAPR